MSQVLVTESYLEDIADAIREKNGLLAQYTPGQMASAIEAIPTGSNPTLITKNIVANGTYSASSDNADGYSQVSVNVSWQPQYVVNATVLTNGYIGSDGSFYYSPSGNYSVYGFQSSKNHYYSFIKNGGNRFRIARFSTDISQATENVSGTKVSASDTNDPYGTEVKVTTNAYYYVFMVDSENSGTPALIIDANAIA